jgi:hypothetical protein
MGARIKVTASWVLAKKKGRNLLLLILRLQLPAHSIHLADREFHFGAHWPMSWNTLRASRTFPLDSTPSKWQMVYCR